ncbi:MAG: TIGR03067 domain-containing protein [Planctomycetes bacterium]|nr:TIGR03067 domain-containing protein [Planctomycetota bacterium]
MRAAFGLFIVVSVPFLVFAQNGDDKSKDKLQGTWKLDGWELEGKAVDLPQSPPWLIIEKDKVLYGGGELATLTVDPRTTPKIIDLTFQDPKRVYEGIYTVDGETLKMCVNRLTDGVKERPSGFDTKDHPEWRLLVFKRDKERKNGAEGLSGFVGIAIQFKADTKAMNINSVIKKSPAEKAGVKMDDKLLSVGGEKAGELKGVVALIQKARPGTELNLRIERDGKERDIAIKVGVLPFYFLD